MRFDAKTHTYWADDGRVVPSITGLLKLAGHVDDRFYTEASRDRGLAVHAATTDLDLGVLDLAAVDVSYRPYVLSYVELSRALKATWTHIEVPFVDGGHGFGGRPDRIGTLLTRPTIAEIKSAVKAKAHQYQTALQAILAAGQGIGQTVGDPPIKPEQFQRLVFYLKPNGRFSVETHDHPGDFTEAYAMIREFGKRRTAA